MGVQGYSWAEDKDHCEEHGRMLSADPSKVSQRAKKRGLPQVNTPLQHLSCHLILAKFASWTISRASCLC